MYVCMYVCMYIYSLTTQQKNCRNQIKYILDITKSVLLKMNI